MKIPTLDLFYFINGTRTGVGVRVWTVVLISV